MLKWLAGALGALLLATAGTTATGQEFSLQTVHLRCEHLENPLGIDVRIPRLSWKLESQKRNTLQTGYQIQVASKPDFAPKNLIWDSGKTASSQSVLVEYAGPELLSGKRYHWRVRVWDETGAASLWSTPAFWEMGLLRESDWKAQWIEPDGVSDGKTSLPPSMLRKAFSLRKKVASARLYVTAHGLYQIWLNGRRVGEDCLTPGWTVYPKRMQYQTYDVTGRLQSGANAIGALLGDGWYRGSFGWGVEKPFYGKKLALLCQLHLRYTDGSESWVLSDGSWKATDEGPIRMSDIYHGETYDARMEIPAWASPAFEDGPWKHVSVANYGYQNLVGLESVPVRRIQELRPVRIFRTPDNTLVADMGQNMVGWVRLRVHGPAGAHIRLRHAEVLDKSGNLYTANLRGAKQEINYTLRGGAEEVYEPHFAFMGFRYVAVDGFPGELKPEHLTGVVVHSAMTPTGAFECSHPLINQLQHNIQWGQKGNFVDVPTDCPQRDERLGWTGDAQVFSRTAAFNMDVAAFFTKWLRDVAADQKPDGSIPFVVPDVLNPLGAKTGGVSAGWGDAGVIIPWEMYQLYGDKRLLETQYPSMKAYVEYIRSKSGEYLIWKGGSVFGDWLFYHPPVNSHPEPDGYTNHDLISTAFYAYSAHLVSEAAIVLGKTDEAQRYAELYQKIRNAFIREYVTSGGRVASDSQTSYVLALAFGLLPEEVRAGAVQHLVNDISSRKKHLSTGFLGTPFLCFVLSNHGHTELAYDLLLQETYPSWLYPVKMGATTIWERWDGLRPDSTFQDAGMNSFNHYAYGAIGDWMYRVVAGIEADPEKPGYKHLYLRPQPDGRLSYAAASVESPYGRIASRWERQGNQMTFAFEVPANTSATILLPGAAVARVVESGKPLTQAAGLRELKETAEGVTLEAGSGKYVFVYDL